MMRRLCDPLLMVTGALDVLYVQVFHSRQLAAIAQDGFFDAIDPNVAYATFDRETASWHLTFGLMAITLGGLVRRIWLRAVRCGAESGAVEGARQSPDQPRTRRPGAVRTQGARAGDERL